MFPTSGKAGGLRISLFVARGQFSQERCFRVAEWIEHLALSGWRLPSADAVSSGTVSEALSAESALAGKDRAR